jgi:hypothetical protein
MPTKAPTIPLAPTQYEQKYQDQLNNILRQYFNQNDNPGQVAGSAAAVGTTKVVAGMNFSRPQGTTQIYSFATTADIANLRVGDVYVDTSAGNVLKMKTS